MAKENEFAKTPREMLARDGDDELPKFKERTLQRSTFGRQFRGAQPGEPRTQLLAAADIWRLK